MDRSNVGTGSGGLTLAESATVEDPFKAYIGNRIIPALEGASENSTLWAARRAAGYLVEEGLRGNVEDVDSGLATIQKGSRALALSVKYQALKILERYNPDLTKDHVFDRLRYHFLGHVAMQLAYDNHLPIDEQRLSAQDAMQFFDPEFSFHTQSLLADMLAAQSYDDEIVILKIEKMLNLQPFNPAEAPTSSPVIQAEPQPSKENNVVMVDCVFCWAQGHILEPSPFGLESRVCGTCGGSGKVPKNL